MQKILQDVQNSDIHLSPYHSDNPNSEHHKSGFHLQHNRPQAVPRDDDIFRIAQKSGYHIG